MDRRSLRRTAKIDYAALNGGASDDDEGGAIFRIEQKAAIRWNTVPYPPLSCGALSL